MKKTDVVTAFLVHRRDSEVRILVLRRSDRVGSYRGQWAGVSGYLEADSALEQALTEIEEEAGLSRDRVKLLATAPPLDVPDREIDMHWRVHPFLFELDDPQSVRIDWEHTEIRWVEPAALREMNTVPGLADALDMLMERWQQAATAGNGEEG